MSSTDRQNRLLVAEDWKRIYQSYRNADFKNYDFDTLRRVMINYIRKNFPEDFNDYIESSEYLALIDLIAFLGQNISFRVDLNARENYLELADRRESVLRLARLINYNPKRNIAASGLLKVSSIKTTESVLDSNNVELANKTVLWNDPSNPNWYEQFIKVINSALFTTNTFGSPVKKEIINGIDTEIYAFYNRTTQVPKFSFNRVVDGSTLRFEVVSADLTDSTIIENAPKQMSKFHLCYRNDKRGSSSGNTGFFSYLVQGNLDSGEFSVNAPSTSQVVSIDVPNINNNDVWLYEIDENGNEIDLWTKVDSVKGNNVIYNSLSKKVKKIYSVLTRDQDKISLIFADGVFGELPKGNFRIYYRTSTNANIVVNPVEMSGVTINFEYITAKNKVETLTINYDLNYTIDNASLTETNLSIKQNAPATYYTQNRLVTAEDYQVGPLSINQEIVKIKSVNRIASGISRYYDLLDATGKYSKTNLFGTDGVLYKEDFETKETFSFETLTDIEGILVNQVTDILNKTKVLNFYATKFPIVPYTDLQLSWNNVSTKTNYSSGYFVNKSNLKQLLGEFSTSVLKLIRIGTAIKFTAPEGYHFDIENNLVQGNADYKGAVLYRWVKIVSVYGTGLDLTEDGDGPVVLNDYMPTGAVMTEIRPFLARNFENDIIDQMLDLIFAYQTFGLRFDRNLGQWRVITDANLNQTNEFSIGKTGDSTNQKLDSSWLLKFTSDGEEYTITYRSTRFIFESDKEIRFYFDSSDKTLNTNTSKIIKDKISILNLNNKPNNSAETYTTNFDWAITEEYRDPFGYVNSKKVEVYFFDSDDDGVVDNYDLFNELVDTENTINNYIYTKVYKTTDGVEDYYYVDNNTENIKIFQSKSVIGVLNIYDDGQIFYSIADNTFYTYNKSTGSLFVNNDYKAYVGRDKLSFRYEHAADNSSRIDPSSTSIIDMYVLTKSYDKDFRNYLNGNISEKPLPISSDSLFNLLGNKVNAIKSMTDEVIYHPVKYRIIFGSKADSTLQGKFKIVKNEELVTNDNDIRANVITYINDFFALDNWDFGETFYFSELSAYVMKKSAPLIKNFILVPSQSDQGFGSLYEVKSEANEIFVSGATVSDVEIIDAITAASLNASKTIITNTMYTNIGIQSN